MTDQMHCTHIIASTANAAAGPSYSVRRLAEALIARGVGARIMSVGAARDSAHEACNGSANADVFAQDLAAVPILGRLSLSRALAKAIDQRAAAGAVLHGHGLWLMPNVYPGWSAARHRCPYVVSPRGMLGPAALQFSRRKKQAFWALAQRRALDAATCLHATSQQECDEIRAYGLATPVAIIPNGIDIPLLTDATEGHSLGAASRTRTVLHLGRIHPKKGIDRLIEAWARIEPSHPDWQLRIVGPSEGDHAAALQARATALGLTRLKFEAGLFGPAKEAAYRDADVFVLPTLNENFGMVVAEALANGRPVICTKGAPWQGLDSEGCGWWIDHGVEPLAAALSDAMAMPRTALDEMGARGRMWMARDFSWERVAADMEGVYRWCSGASERPAFVELAA